MSRGGPAPSIEEGSGADFCNPNSATPQLCDPGQVPSPLCRSHSIEQDQYQDLALPQRVGKLFHLKHLRVPGSQQWLSNLVFSGLRSHPHGSQASRPSVGHSDMGAEWSWAPWSPQLLGRVMSRDWIPALSLWAPPQ